MQESIIPASVASAADEAGALSILRECLGDMAPASLRADGTYAALAAGPAGVAGAVVVAWDDETLGTFGYELALAGMPVGAGACVLESLAVGEAFRGNGVGTALARHALDLAAARGFRVAYAAALMRPSHGSRNLLGRCGFRPVSDRIPLRDSLKDDCVLCSSAPCSCRVVLLAADLG